jgi:hypothetical protein
MTEKVHLWIPWLKNWTANFAPGSRRLRPEVRERVAEVIELADGDALDLMRSRSREQEVLDMLDEPTAR